MTHLRDTLTEEQLECLRGCSSYKQYYTMRQRFEKGDCVFCNLDREINKVIYENACWVVWEVPQGFTTKKSVLQLQLLIVPMRHARSIDDLSMDEWISLKMAYQWIFRQYPEMKKTGGCDFARFNDMRYNVGTVPHYHINVWVPNREGAVSITLQKTPEKWAEHEKRMRAFASQYETGEKPE